jgi:hypothetical protein
VWRWQERLRCYRSGDPVVSRIRPCQKMIRPESEGHVACDIPGSEFQLGLARGLLELQPFCCHLAQPAAHPRGCDASCRCGFMARLRSAASQSFASWNGLSALRRSAHEQRERNQSAREAHAREALFLLFERASRVLERARWDM